MSEGLCVIEVMFDDAGRPFDYRFDCVLGGHPLDEEVSAALREMTAETARLRVFGSYRADREEGWETVAA